MDLLGPFLRRPVQAVLDRHEGVIVRNYVDDFVIMATGQAGHMHSGRW